MEIHVDVYKNKMALSSGDRNVTVYPEKPFSTTRLLLGEFFEAEACLKQAIQDFGAVGFFKPKPKIIIQPHDYIEGGLSTIERRLLRELGYGAGAKDVHVLVK